jgi:putative ABC transport system substrate-binding protein
MRRRAFIALLAAAAADWRFAALAQQAPRARRIGVLMNYAEDDERSQARIAALLDGLKELGWTAGHDAQIDYRWGVGDAELNRRNAAELVALAPDVIVTSGGAVTAALLRTTRTIPVVFVNVFDPAGAGFVQTMARPGGNATGFTPFAYGMSGKWLELLKQIAPGVTRVAILHNPIVASRSGQLNAIEALAPTLRVELSALGVREPDAIERAVTAFARTPNGGLTVVGAPSLATYHELIVALAAKYRLPAIYPYRIYAAAGGLISYGPDLAAQFRRAAAYVDRILKGDKPADLPVQPPAKYDMLINLKTAKALELTVPPALLSLADQLIE